MSEWVRREVYEQLQERAAALRSIGEECGGLLRTAYAERDELRQDMLTLWSGCLSEFEGFHGLPDWLQQIGERHPWLAEEPALPKEKLVAEGREE